MTKAELMQEALAEQVKERQEQERKLAKLIKQMDHLERARRQEEGPLLEAAYATQLDVRACWSILSLSMESLPDQLHLFFYDLCTQVLCLVLLPAPSEICLQQLCNPFSMYSPSTAWSS